MAIEISDDNLNFVKKVMAYPSVDNIILTDDQIKSLCVKPAMDKYFIKFPIRSKYAQSISGDVEVTVNYPDSYTYGVTDVRVVGKDTPSGGNDSFWQLAAYQSQSWSSKSAGNYGVKGYNPNFIRQHSQNYTQAAASFQNQKGTIHARVDHPNRQVLVYSTVSGKINIEWAKFSEDFSDVRYEYQYDVLQLAQSYFLDHMADTTQIIDTGGDISINYSELRGRAAELRDPILEKWDSQPEIIFIRQI